MSHASFSGHFSSVSPVPGRSGWVPVYNVKIPVKKSDGDPMPRHQTGLIVVTFMKLFDPLSSKLLAMRDSGDTFENVSVEGDISPERGGDMNAVNWGFYLRNVTVTGWLGVQFDGKPGEHITLEANSWSRMMVKGEQERQAGESTVNGMARRY